MLIWGLVLTGIASVVLPVMAYNEWNDDDAEGSAQDVDTSFLDEDPATDAPKNPTAEEMGSSFIVYQDVILAELQNITNVPRDGIEITMS